ncbi:MAG: sulfotransferase [Steroidobacteraceae bacterium]
MRSQNYLKLALDAYQKRSFGEAERWLGQAVLETPDNPDVHAWHCEILRSAGRFPEAELAAQRALGLSPRHADALYNLSVVLLTTGREAEALALLQVLVQAHPEHVLAWHNLGILLERSGSPARALACYEAATATGRALPATAASLAALLVELGQHDRARELYAARLAADPNDVEAHFAYSRLVTYRADMAEWVALKRAVASIPSLPWQAAVKLGFALGKAQQDLGDYEGALGAFMAANELHYRHRPYAESTHHALLGDILRTVDAGLLQRVAAPGAAGVRPVFILGMPRSGSTLLEQMLLSHGEVASGGELKYLKAVIQAHLIQDRHTIARAAPGWNQDQFAAAALDYRQRLSRHAEGKALVIDKLPGNFAFAGLIAGLFPDAIIIHTVRQPLAVLWSAYSTHFGDALLYTYDMAVLARYVARYREVMQHWERVLPAGRIIPVAYEQLVLEPERVLRLVVAQMGLDWRPSMLDFHQSGRSVRTASVAQVRQPLHGAAVALWRHYQDFLLPHARAAGLA